MRARTSIHRTLWVSQNYERVECFKALHEVDKIFNFFGNYIWELNCNYGLMRHEFAPEAQMSFFHRVDQRQARPRLGLAIETEDRLSVGQSVVVIAGLSALSWAVLISIVMGLRALL